MPQNDELKEFTEIDMEISGIIGHYLAQEVEQVPLRAVLHHESQPTNARTVANERHDVWMRSHRLQHVYFLPELPLVVYCRLLW
jgi:GAF domain-containing protein